VTAIVATAALMVPFAIFAGLPGFEIVGPMALVTLGGLLTTALLSLLVIPTAFQAVGQAEAEAAEAIAIPVEGAPEPEPVGAR
jgi:Cu/Ag efflux pump CusA